MTRSGSRLFQPSSQSCTKRKCDMPALSPRGFEARPERFYRRHPLACYRLVSTPVRSSGRIARLGVAASAAKVEEVVIEEREHALGEVSRSRGGRGDSL